MEQRSSVQAVSMHLHQKIHTNGLQAAIDRKYPNQPYDIHYIDIESEDIADDNTKEIAEQVRNDEFFYPLVMIEDEMIGEGYIQLKPVFAELEKHGYIAESE